MKRLRIKKLNSGASIKIATKGSAGFDLCCTDIGTIRCGEQEKIQTGIAVAIPEGYVGFIKPRSGLAVKHNIDVMAGVIDSDYRGELIVVLRNHGKKDFYFDRGDRIAQLVIIQNLTNSVFVSELNDTDRNDGGFGSTGV